MANPDALEQTDVRLGLLRDVAVADHPHTDPGDGRTECDVCGKWVWLVTHSCKRIPVTDAARQRAAQRGGGAGA